MIRHTPSEDAVNDAHHVIIESMNLSGVLHRYTCTSCGWKSWWYTYAFTSEGQQERHKVMIQFREHKESAFEELWT